MRAQVAAVALLVALGCSSGDPSSPGTPAAPQPPAPAPVRVLMLTATAGFRHDSIPAARETMTRLAASGGFTVTQADDAASITPAALASHDVLLFALTTGELPFTADQKAAILAFVSGGKGFMGVHSASDTLYGWPEYGQLVGAYFREHPWTQPATVVVEDRGHPVTSGLPDGFLLNEEFYVFRENPRPRVQVLLRLDAASVGATGDYPLAWAQNYGSGRSWYNALGHFPETWRDQRFERQLSAAVRWTANR